MLSVAVINVNEGFVLECRRLSRLSMSANRIGALVQIATQLAGEQGDSMLEDGSDDSETFAQPWVSRED